MKIFSDLNEFSAPGRGIFCTIGMFDGIHRGHQHVIQNTVDQAKRANGHALIITFDPHPARVVAPEHAPLMIYPPGKRRQLLAESGADFVWMIPFDQAFSRLTGQAFLELICDRFKPLQSICVGPDFHFGYQRSGNVNLLNQQSSLLQFDVPKIVPVTEGEQEISSTEIRKCVQSGELEQAANLLGRPYELSGSVVSGQKLGRKIGFPTANLNVDKLVIPPNGVYPVRAQLNEATYNGVMNIGVRPTLENASNPRLVEVHLFDCDQDFYGETLTVQPLEMIRPERKFPSLDALTGQIQIDCQEARTRLSSAAQ